MNTLRVSVPDDDWAVRLHDLADRVDFVVWDVASPQPPEHLDLVVLPYTVASGLLSNLEPGRTGVVQSQALGYDRVRELLPAGITYSNAVGVHEGSTAELAVALLLASARNLDLYARERGGSKRRWGTSLADRRIMLLGVGGIGFEVQKRLEGFGAELVRVARHARADERGQIHGVNELETLLPTVDAVVVAVPLSDDTAGMIDDGFLSALPDGAIVVNVSRGRIVDTDAVLRQGGRIRFASDVTDPEPLPADHPLWDVPGVLISPHVGGLSTSMAPRIERVVRDQIAALLAGEPPRSVVFGPGTAS